MQASLLVPVATFQNTSDDSEPRSLKLSKKLISGYRLKSALWSEKQLQDLYDLIATNNQHSFCFKITEDYFATESSSSCEM